MNIFVTGLAQSDAIGNVVAQIFVMFPRLNMMGLYLSCCATVLASVVVANVDSLTPLTVFVAIALLVAVWLTRCESFALSTAILGFEFSACGEKLLEAMSARQFLSGTTSGRQLTAARLGTRSDYLACAKAPSKWSATDDTLCAMAGGAVSLARVIGFELTSAQITQDQTDGDWRDCPFAAGVFYAELCAAFDLLCTFGKRALFACCHMVIVPQYAVFCNLERWSVATGKTPIKLTG
jgi:hypothetical protein